MTYVSRTGPYVPNLGNFTTAAELASTKPANLYNPGTTAYTADQGLMITDGTIWDTAGAIPGEVELKAATYAIARTLSGTATGDRLQVLGRTTQSDGGQGLFTWVQGGTTTVDEGYVLQATGGTWQRDDPSPTKGETLLNAVWFNIKPTNADTVNDTGFAKLKAQMQTSATTTWRVFFPPGAYTYTNNRWLMSVQRVIIEAYDCTFQCTSSGSDKGFLQTNDYFIDYGDLAFPGTGVYTSGYLINTAAAGAVSITTTTHSDAGNFTAGMRVVLHGYDQQGAGYPPNPRYFEHLTVATANGSTGVVTFTDQLQNSYDSRWWDTANYVGTAGFGAPRILSLDRTNYTKAKLMWFKGFTILANPNGRTTPQLPGSDLCILEDITATCFNAAMTGVCIIRRSKFTNAVAGDLNSGDKIVDRLVIEDSLLDATALGGAFEALDDCIACNSVSFIRSKFCGYISVSPRNLTMSDCDVIPPASVASAISTLGNAPVRAVNIASTRVYNTGSLANGWTNQGSPGFSLTVGTVTGTDIQISFDATGKTVAHQIEYGMTLTNTATGNTGVITAIYYETGSPGNLRIAGSWAAPSPADVFRYYDAMQISDGGGNVIVGTQVQFWRGPPGPVLPFDINGTNVKTLDFADIAGPGNTYIKVLNSPFAHRGLEFRTMDGTQRMVLDDRFLTLGTGVGLNLSNRPIDYFEAGTATAIAGSATLVGGTKTVTNTVVTNANYRVRMVRHAAGGTLGHLSYSIIDNTSFTITSSSGTDTSTIEWWLHYNF